MGPLRNGPRCKITQEHDGWFQAQVESESQGEHAHQPQSWEGLQKAFLCDYVSCPAHSASLLGCSDATGEHPTGHPLFILLPPFADPSCSTHSCLLPSSCDSISCTRKDTMRVWAPITVEVEASSQSTRMPDSVWFCRTHLQTWKRPTNEAILGVRHLLQLGCSDSVLRIYSLLTYHLFQETHTVSLPRIDEWIPQLNLLWFSFPERAISLCLIVCLWILQVLRNFSPMSWEAEGYGLGSQDSNK